MDHKITDISVQARNPNRVNISIDGKYRLSLHIHQITELDIKNGAEVTSEQIAKWEEESLFGKLYSRATEYCLMRPHSAQEIRDYLWRKTLTRRVSVKTKNEERRTKIIEKVGVGKEIADKVYDRLVQRGYVDDKQFARYWLENRNLTKGASRRKLIMELRGKGVEQDIIEKLLPYSARTDEDEIQKIISKRAKRYADDDKLIQYLIRQGFQYDDVRSAVNQYRSDRAEGTAIEMG